MHLPEIDRARLAESALRVQIARLRREIAARDADSAVRGAEERHRVLVEEMFARLGLEVGVDSVDADTGRVARGAAPQPQPPASEPDPPAEARTSAG